MFTKTIEWPPVGLLRGEGQSAIWKGRVAFAPFNGEFEVVIRGDKTAPTMAQQQAMKKLIQNASNIQFAATDEAVRMLRAASFDQPDLALDSSNVWDFLQPRLIEIQKTDFLESNEIAIFLGFAVSWNDDFLLQIGTVDGEFDTVYVE